MSHCESSFAQYASADHYLGHGRMTVFVNHQLFSVSLHELLNPRDLVYAAMFFHAQRSRRLPPRLPRHMQLQFRPPQLQRFLRGCVLATAHALVTPPASVWLDAATMWCWSHSIFVRVMSGFVAKAEVRRHRALRQGARFSFASAGMVWPSFH
jgi:hypothetical protein